MAFLPFGAGGRMCVASKLGARATVGAAACLLRRLRFALPAEARSADAEARAFSGYMDVAMADEAEFVVTAR
jgi:cytochrome P450